MILEQLRINRGAQPTYVPFGRTALGPAQGD